MTEEREAAGQVLAAYIAANRHKPLMALIAELEEFDLWRGTVYESPAPFWAAQERGGTAMTEESIEEAFAFVRARAEEIGGPDVDPEEVAQIVVWRDARKEVVRGLREFFNRERRHDEED